MIESIGLSGLILSLLFVLIYVLLRFISKKKVFAWDIIFLVLIGFIVATAAHFLQQQTTNQVVENLKSLEDQGLIKEIKINVDTSL